MRTTHRIGTGSLPPQRIPCMRKNQRQPVATAMAHAPPVADTPCLRTIKKRPLGPLAQSTSALVLRRHQAVAAASGRLRSKCACTMPAFR